MTVYVLDRHERVRAALTELVDGAEGMSIIGSSSDGLAGLSEIVRLRPHVAVVDGYLGDGDGLDLCRHLHRSVPEVGCVIVTAGLGRPWGTAEAADAGAAALVVKQLRDFPLLDVIARVAAGERLLHPRRDRSARPE